MAALAAWPGSVDARAARHVKLKCENSSATGAGDRRAGPPRPSRSAGKPRRPATFLSRDRRRNERVSRSECAAACVTYLLTTYLPVPGLVRRSARSATTRAIWKFYVIRDRASAPPCRRG